MKAYRIDKWKGVCYSVIKVKRLTIEHLKMQKMPQKQSR